MAVRPSPLRQARTCEKGAVLGAFQTQACVQALDVLEDLVAVVSAPTGRRAAPQLGGLAVRRNPFDWVHRRQAVSQMVCGDEFPGTRLYLPGRVEHAAGGCRLQLVECKFNSNDWGEQGLP